jgi:hypothetical protein
MTLIRSPHIPHFVLIPLASLLVACSSGTAKTPADAATEDAALPCPEPSPDSGSPCVSPGEACVYPSANPIGLTCFCIAPEKIWLCCNNAFAFECPQYDERSRFAVGTPCCPAIYLSSYGCSWCASDDMDVTLTCSNADPHWRQTEKSCVFVGGVDAGTDANAGLDGSPGG